MLRSYLHLSMSQGAALATIGHLLAPAFERLYIASSFHYRDLFPWGSHPLLDPLWSSDMLEFIHHGCEARRIEKVEFIAGFDAALNNLRVCHLKGSNEGAYNCSRCSKCVRTMLSLEVAGKLSQCPCFHQPLDALSVTALATKDRYRSFLAENLEAMRRRGIRPDLQRVLEGLLRGPALLRRWRRGLARRKLRRLQR